MPIGRPCSGGSASPCATAASAAFAATRARSKSRATMAFTAWSTASIRAMQLSSSSTGDSCLRPISARAVDRVVGRRASVMLMPQYPSARPSLRGSEPPIRHAARAVDPDRLAAAMRPLHRFQLVAQPRQPRRRSSAGCRARPAPCRSAGTAAAGRSPPECRGRIPACWCRNSDWPIGWKCPPMTPYGITACAVLASPCPE